MSWLSVHTIAEEAALWSTLVINATIIATAVPTGIAYAKNISRERIARLAFRCATATFFVGAIAAVSLMIFAPPGTICNSV